MGSVFKSKYFNNFTVRQADESDAHSIIRILRDAAGWLIEKGIHQWDVYLTDEAAAEINKDITKGTTYIVEDSQFNAIATFNLSKEQNDLDKSVWGNRDDNALYLHRLAIDKHYRHLNLGRELLNWILANAAGSVLRLDCIADNPRLNQFYRDTGFTFVGYAEAKSIMFSKYEKPVNA
ncbi:GNAT family N-acetyltransferase [Lentibacillus sp. CBA3610]|uniref:GNAT family N-acetyltransferase n=1 Tax=Lentibacillus sp. CBA3610 TaxID=2518176 RepID=UPI0015957F43|nr:GNAT family N-acetyltransferase [Lentibacillus sp. CBA3610]QKY71162.1 GNAT family N-acetyltransferase [Lentibacillus sp. CBA3610]